MPRFIIERDVGEITPEQIEEAGRHSVEVLDSMVGVEWIRSYVSYAEGKIYCEYDAADADAVREHARRTGFPCDRISEIGLEISPAMFR